MARMLAAIVSPSEETGQLQAELAAWVQPHDDNYANRQIAAQRIINAYKRGYKVLDLSCFNAHCHSLVGGWNLKTTA